ncbi:MAG: HAMP domain-containing protein [Chloroflexi bacterium]|nr:HAMP domain-containing protein [Chloroflexota bacterium]MBP7043187.1 HAMP domain-containing protein [Chloroflexota bacterium]
MINTLDQSKPLAWLLRASWRILLLGAAFALLVAVLLMQALMQAPLADVAQMVTTLTVTSLISLGVGYVLFRYAARRSPSFSLTLVLTYGWAGVVTLFNVWIMSERMFASQHDLILSGVLLLFAAIVATSFGVFVAANLNTGLRELADSAQQIAAGNLDTRAVVQGQDEVARVAATFNQMAAQLQQAANEREELENLRRDLIAWTSHDLRTPLTSIRAMIEALHDGVVEDPQTVQRYYRTIRADIIALNGLIDDLFELAQLEAGGLSMEFGRYSLGDVIVETLETFQALAKQRQVSLVANVGPDVDPVRLNVAKIHRVLANLLSNGLRYTPDGGSIWVTAVRTSDGVVVTVRDSGAGFNEIDLPRVFEQFYRGEQARTRAAGGAGLGLAIAQAIVGAHNGRIWAENVPDGGALVGFLLPD